MKTKLGSSDRAELARVVEQALAEGAFGLSTGLEYDPGRIASLDELAAAAEPVGVSGGIVMSHLRSEDDDKIDQALDELIEQGRRSRAKVHVAHMKVVYGHGASRADEILAKLTKARADGIDITADMYPYTASYTTIGILFPDYARGGGKKTGHGEKEILTYLHDRVMKRNGPEATLFGTGDLAGKTLAEVARARGAPFERVLFELGPNGGAAAYFVMDDALETRLLLDPFVSIGTDGGGGDPHPRSHGSFTRVIEDLVEKRGALSLEEAIRKMTSLPAHALGLDGDRGCLKAGCAADVDVFVPEDLHTRADFLKPKILAEGMRAVIVNGVLEREGADVVRAHGGRALRPLTTKSAKSTTP
jgi:N-acyl-D-amino-acid deacylase